MYSSVCNAKTSDVSFCVFEFHHANFWRKLNFLISYVILRSDFGNHPELKFGSDTPSFENKFVTFFSHLGPFLR